MSAYALITGASMGIGAVFAKELASRKKNLILTARSLDKLNALADELRAAHGVDVKIIAADLSTLDGAEHVLHACEKEKLDVELLINNAGFGFIGEFTEQPLENIEQMILLNNLAAAKLARLFAPKFIARGGGRMMNIASVAAFNAIPSFAVYAATKAFLVSLSEALNEELESKGVTVTAICPGFTDTPFLEKVGQSQEKTLFPLELPEVVVKTALAALDRKKSLVITSIWYRVTIFLYRFLPRRIISKISEKVLAHSQIVKK